MRRHIDWLLVAMVALVLLSVGMVGFCASQLSDAIGSGSTALWTVLLLVNFGNCLFMGSVLGRHLAQR